MTTVREATFDFLRSVGVDTFFGNPGSTELAMLDRWPDDIRYVLGLHEASVVGMADGYARATGKCGFVNVHSAAGLGHSLGNLYTAYRNRAPLVVIAGQQTRGLLPNYPFLGASDAVDFPKPYVKYSVEPARAEDVPAAIAQAYRIAMQRPWGPTFVSVPADDWAAPCDPVPARQVSVDCAPDPALVAQAAALIDGAKAPAFVVGAEVDEEGAGADMIRLAERVGAPVYAAPFAARIAFPETHPLFAGFLPAAPEKVSDTICRHDVAVAVGAPVFTYHVPGRSRLADGSVSIVQLTTDAAAAASAPVGTAMVGSLRLGLPMLTDQLSAPARSAPAPRRAAATPKPGKTITPDVLMEALGRHMTPGMTLVEEAPSLRPVMQDHVRLTEWGSFFTMASGGLGYGLPAAVGHGLGKPDRKTVCLIGDGSFMYSPQALWTAVQQGLNMAVILVNNGGYGAMRSFSKVLQVRDVPGIEVGGLGFPDLAAGMGCPAQKVFRRADLEQALSATLATQGPSLLEVEIDPEVQILY